MTLTLAGVARWVERNFWRRSVYRATSSGVTHANLPVKLDAAGKLDDSFTADTLTPATGITFGQDTLNYYDEGTWTPANPQVTLASVVGWYTRIGRMVFFGFRVVWPGTADSNAATITGLPFTPAAPGGLTANMFGGQITLDTGATGARILTVNQTNQINILTAGLAAITNATMSGQTIRGVGSYYV